MRAIITTMALCFTLILAPGLACSQTPPPGPVYQPLEQQTKGPLDLSRHQSTENGKYQAQTTLPKFPQATLPLANKSCDYTQNSSSQPQTDKNFEKKPSSQVAVQDSRKAKASTANSWATPAWRPSYQSGFQPGTLSAGFKSGNGNPDTGLAPLSAYLQDNNIGTCFDRYLQYGFSGKTRKAAASEDNWQTDKEKQQQSKHRGWGLPEKPRQNY